MIRSTEGPRVNWLCESSCIQQGDRLNGRNQSMMLVPITVWTFRYFDPKSQGLSPAFIWRMEKVRLASWSLPDIPFWFASPSWVEAELCDDLLAIWASGETDVSVPCSRSSGVFRRATFLDESSSAFDASGYDNGYVISGYRKDGFASQFGFTRITSS